MCAVDSSELRLSVANHLEDHHRAMYCDFLSEPVASHDAYDADTEASSEEDALIATVADPQLQTQLRWKRYTERLSGAWGDKISVQGIADMFSVTVNVLSSQTQTIIPITPSSGTSQHDVYVGLIMQA